MEDLGEQGVLRIIKEGRELVHYLDYEEKIRALKRRWLVRRWPELRLKSSSRDLGFLIDQYISESFLRDDDSADAIRGEIEQRFTSFVAAEPLNPEEIQAFPLKELLHYLPELLKNFKVSVRMSIVEVITKKPYSSNANSVNKKIVKELSVLDNQTNDKVPFWLTEVEHILRDSNSLSKKRKRSAVVFQNITGSRFTAIESILNQLNQLPKHSLHAMFVKLREESVQIRPNSKRVSFSTSYLTNRIKDLINDFILDPNKDLPTPVRNALQIASLSARQLCGKDGGISAYLGAVPMETIALQNDFLKAISHIKDLDHKILENTFHYLFPDSSVHKLPQQKLQLMMETALLDWLFESCGGHIPESVIHCVNKIISLFGKSSKHPEVQSRIDEELVSVMNVSSHLQQLIHDSAERANSDTLSSDLDLPEDDVCCDLWFNESSTDSVPSMKDNANCSGDSFEPAIAVEQKSSLRNLGSQDSQREISEDHNRQGKKRNRMEVIQDIGDQVSLFGYHLFGCMTEKLLKNKQVFLESDAQRYLVSDYSRTAKISDPGKSSNVEDTDVSLLLDEAEELLPRTCAARVVKKVRQALSSS